MDRNNIVKCQIDRKKRLKPIIYAQCSKIHLQLTEKPLQSDQKYLISIAAIEILDKTELNIDRQDRVIDAAL